MIKLIEVNETNWMDIRKLSVHEHQKNYLDSALAMLARGYVYRSCRAKVYGIAKDDTLIGAALCKDLDEEPVCYDLQQFMIDRAHQGKGCGTEALRLILSALGRERKYDCVEVSVRQDNAAALRMYWKAGFTDTGYIDEEAPYCVNLRYHFQNSSSAFSDTLLSDFTNAAFQKAFQRYFSELGIDVQDWDDLFRQMNEEGGNEAFVRIGSDGAIIGFIQYKPITLTSWFLEETRGFIREFWIDEAYRGQGHGAALLQLAEQRFKQQGICTIVLTTDTAERFYLQNGYRKAPACNAKNGYAVYRKEISE